MTGLTPDETGLMSTDLSSTNLPTMDTEYEKHPIAQATNSCSSPAHS